ncbi:MAG: S1 family peptidase, partial [Pseudobdellovibrionaceae bacterium]
MKHHFFTLYMLLAFALLSSACGKHPSDAGVIDETKDPFEIIGGHDVDRTALGASSTVMITGDTGDGTSFICTGTLMSSRDVLTAAHCISPNVDSMTVIFELNAFEAKAEPVTITIEKVFRYSPSKMQKQTGKNSETKPSHDLGWIRLKESPPVAATFAVLASNQTFELKEQDSVLVLGYGRTNGLDATDAADLSGSGILRSTSVQIQSLEAQTFTILQTLGRGVCFGDSGGPAYRKTSSGQLVLVGVASAVDRIKGDPTVSNDICENKSIFTNL